MIHSAAAPFYVSYPPQVKVRGVLLSGRGPLLGVAVGDAAVLHVLHRRPVLRPRHMSGKVTLGSRLGGVPSQ